MLNKYLLSYLLVLFGELILIISFFHFGNTKHADILYLNIAVSTIIYLLLFRGTISVWMGVNSSLDKRIASLGVIWFFIFIYSILAILVMFFSNNQERISFNSQLIYQSFIFFILLLGFYFSSQINQKEKSVSDIEFQSKSYINQIKKIATIIDNELSTRINIDVTADDTNSLKKLIENITYLYPNNSLSGRNNEVSLINNLNQILELLKNHTIDYSALSLLVNSSQDFYTEIKNTYSI